MSSSSDSPQPDSFTMPIVPLGSGSELSRSSSPNWKRPSNTQLCVRFGVSSPGLAMVTRSLYWKLRVVVNVFLVGQPLERLPNPCVLNRCVMWQSSEDVPGAAGCGPQLTVMAADVTLLFPALQ